MPDQAQMDLAGAAVDAAANAGRGRAFSPPGEPVIHGVNRLGLWTLYIKEIRRFLKVQTQTIWGPAVSTVLFLIIFAVAFGRGDREVLGVSFVTFIAPGLIMMGMMQNAFANSSFALLVGKIQGTIVDLLMPPLSTGELMAGITAAAMTRAVLVGLAVAFAVWLYPGAELMVAHPWAIIAFGLLGSLMLALLGLLTSIWAEKFDHAAAVTTLVVAPLSLLSGTFYVIDNLSEFFQTVSRLNPFFYVISGFRYGFLGQSDIGDGSNAVVQAAFGLGIFNVVLVVLCYRILRSGWKIKS